LRFVVDGPRLAILGERIKLRSGFDERSHRGCCYREQRRYRGGRRVGLRHRDERRFAKPHQRRYSERSTRERRECQ
jgi:hypothetical protein